MLSRIIIAANVFCVLMGLCLTAVNAQPQSEASEEVDWPNGTEIPYSIFMNIVEQDKVRQAEFHGNRINAWLKNYKAVTTYVPMGEKPVARLLERKVVVTAHSTDDPPSAGAVFVMWLPYLLYIFSLWLFLARPLWRIVRRLEQLRFPGSPSVSAVDIIKGERS